MSEGLFTTIGDEPVEARIVAWVLGEASAFEAAELERLCGERPELMIFKRRMLALHGLLAEAENPQADESWKLPAEKRRKLEFVLWKKNVADIGNAREKRVKRSGRHALLAIAACLMLTVVVAGLLAPAGIRQRKKSDVAEARSMEIQRELAALEGLEMGERMQPLRTDLPQELIEGTPRPNNVPNLEAPADGPAGSGTWSVNEESQLAYKPKASSEPPARPSAPVSSLAKAIAASTASASAVPVSEEVTTPSLDFGDSDEFSTGIGEDKEKKETLSDLTELMEEIAASEEPYSTFSLNISDASFRIAQAAMDKGERPDPAGVKVEQFYNAVDYGDPSPAAGEPVSCAIEQAAHPVIPGRNLVRVALKTAAAGRSATQPLHLTLLVDQSGSMSRADRRAAMDASMASLGKLLTEKDIVNIVGFSRTSRLVADGMKGDEAGKKLAALVNQSASEGGTNLETAIDLAGQMAQRRTLDGAQNRIVLFTDGAANLGDADPQRLAAKVGQLRQQGVAFDIAGIAADGLNDELLGELARKGNGRYYVVGKGAEEDFAKQLAGAFRPAAENVKVQVRFNPERVTRYKLIGFEKDRLKTEDFRNDKVDAAELAAEEAGVAIYQIEPNPNGSGEIGEVSVRFRDTASGEMVERGWTIPHDAAAPVIDRATPSMQLATLAMFAAEKLKGGPLGEAIDFKQFAEPQANVKQFFGGNARVAEVLRMLEMLK